MKKWLPSFLVALFVAVPTVIVVADYMNTHEIHWVALLLWAICVILAIAFTAGGTDEHE